LAKKNWKSLSKTKRIAILIGISVQLSLLATAQLDITRRSAAEINGSKLLWRAIVLINFVGPLAYFMVGRKQLPRPA
jgi:hypothetical protein